MALTLKNVLISDSVDDKCVKILEENGIEVVKNTKLSKEELITEIAKYEGLIVRSATKVTADVITAGHKLKIIGRAGTGVDNIDCDAATRNGVIVMNTPGGNTLSAAEHTCAMILATSRSIASGTESLRAGRWDRKKFMGNEVYGKTLAIIGLGRIGQEVATRMQSFGMTTIGYDPIILADESAKFNTEWMELEQLWPKADYITVHVPLIPPTKHMVGNATLAKCKKGVRIINVARGGIVDEDALLAALKTGQCGAAGLDVFVEEPPTNLELIQHPNVTSTPHLGASTIEAQTRVAEEIAQQFVDMVQGKCLFGAINANAMVNALSEETKPWVKLATALGQLAGILLGSVTSSTSINITTEGESLAKASSYLSAASLVGLLRSQTDNGLNMISAPAMAKKLGIKVNTQHSTEVLHGMDTVSLEVQETGGAIHTLTGITAASRPVLTSIDSAPFKQGTLLKGNLVIYKAAADAAVLPKVLDILSAAKSSLTNYSASLPAAGQTWNVLQVTPKLENLDELKKHVEVACQMHLL